MSNTKSIKMKSYSKPSLKMLQKEDVPKEALEDFAKQLKARQKRKLKY